MKSAAIKNFLLLFCSLIFFTAGSSAQNRIENITNWQFKRADDTKWLPATVPGTIHTDLLNQKIIDDPFFGDNEKKLQWIDTCTWDYQAYFDCDSVLLSSRHIDLQFEGLDTYAYVYLNEQLLLVADNMFRTWQFDCKKVLKRKQNHLYVRIKPASGKGKTLAKNLPYILPGDEKVFTRKAAYQYGWDWGPRFVTCGIWRPVNLVAWNNFKINNIQIIQKELSDSVANLVASVNISSDTKTTIKLMLDSENDEWAPFEFEMPVSVGENTLVLPFWIDHPKRWWCNGLGDPFLYTISLEVSDSKKIYDKTNFSFGLRTVELVQERDSIGKSFYFKLNGVPVFMKGANYVPPDNFLPRVSEKRYREIIQSAVDANMNMLRVWGGGVYEDEQFYRLCDENGILIWQDFMFAGGMYPGDTEFLENVRLEAIDNVVRLRNHPCIALWCGNNEVDEGWHNWGWQKQYNYSANDSAKIWHDYQKIFEDLLPGVIKQFDYSRSYWPSSPSIGWGHPESLTQGDSHYWGVWWGMEPFSNYKKKVGRFMSEYGFQGMPAISTFKKICMEKDLSLKSAAVKNHQKHPTGYETIQDYLEREYKKPSSFENYIYVSQLLQAEGIKTALEAHRRAKPVCMGTLFWQLNDCWPVTSWSSTDYYGNWKALHYVVKKTYEDILVSPVFENGKLNVYVVNDSQAKQKAVLEMKLCDFYGKVQWSENIPVEISGNSSAVYFSIDSTDLVKNSEARNVFFSVKLVKESDVLSENVLYFIKVKNLKLTRAVINYNFTMKDKQVSLELESGTLSKNVELDFGDPGSKPADNYFDLLPNEKKTILVESKMTMEELKKRIKIKTLVDTY